ncbi:MAG: hypothetical protein FWE25_09670 [Lachnospiraceae bacterium]|nr:hypothetical protein [Lachnospiraceae bacterium]
MNQRIQKIALGGMLIALGIVIPMFSPIRVIIEPASFTLASHVVIFIAMFISPTMAFAVAVGTTIGFFVGGFPIVVVLRAATHLVFAMGGAFYIQQLKRTDGYLSPLKLRLFSFVIAMVHAICEVIVVSLFYFGGTISQAHLDRGFFFSVILLVGLGSVIHSMVDLEIAHVVIIALKKQKNMDTLFALRVKKPLTLQKIKNG